MSNLLGLADQIYFVGERATGAAAVMQAVWVYNHAIDIDGLRRFHRHLHGGRLSRRVERSPCRSAATAGSRHSTRRSSKSALHLGPARSSTPGSTLRPLSPLTSNTDPNGILRCCPSPTVVPESAWSSPTASPTAWDCAGRLPTRLAAASIRRTGPLPEHVRAARGARGCPTDRPRHPRDRPRRRRSGPVRPAQS